MKKTETSTLNWNSDKFEDMVLQGLVGLYETKLNADCRHVPKHMRMNDLDFLTVRKKGLYFPAFEPISGDYVDLDAGSVPNSFFWSYFPQDEPDFCPNKDYSAPMKPMFHHFSIKQMGELPSKVKTAKKGKLFQVVRWNPMLYGEIVAAKTYAVLDKFGWVHVCEHLTNNGWEPIDTKNDASLHTASVLANCIDVFQQKDKNWKIKATDGHVSARFGCTQNEVKSLLYARTAPMTESGRKRPILHIVQSHKRRIKEGHDVDISPYYRGVFDLEINGFKFTVFPEGIENTLEIKPNKKAIGFGVSKHLGLVSK